MRFAGIILSPSMASIIACSLLSFGALLVSTLIYNARTGFLFSLIFGPGSSAELILSTRETTDAIFQTIFSNPLLNKLIFFAFWCFVGLCVYFFLSGLGKTGSTLVDTTEQLHYLNAKKTQFEEELGLRLMVQSIGLFLGFLYSVFFIRLLLPFSILAGRIGASNLNSVVGWLYLLAGFMVLGLSLHLIIVLMRLISLRPRLYGGWDDVLEGKLSHHQLDN